MRVNLDVVIPAFNAENSIRGAIDSAMRVRASRVIVVDDGSIDNTAQIARRAGAELISQSNMGASEARRRGLLRSTGEYVVLLDADDELVEEGVERSIRELDQDPSLVAAGGAAIGHNASYEYIEISPSQGLLRTDRLLEQGYSPVPPACIVWRRTAAVSAAGDEDVKPLRPRYAEDYELLVRAALRGPVRFHNVPSARYSLDGGKSAAEPANSIRASADIREYYASISGIRIGTWRERHIRARVALRLSRNEKGPRRLGLVIRASLLDPRMVVLIISQRLLAVR